MVLNEKQKKYSKYSKNIYITGKHFPATIIWYASRRCAQNIEVFIYLKHFLYKLFLTNHLLKIIANIRGVSDSDGILSLTISWKLAKL